MDFTDFYALNYTGARNKFRAAAGAAGAAQCRADRAD